MKEPNALDATRLMAIGAWRGVPVMLGCIDCAHWVWKNYLPGWSRKYNFHVVEATVILEATS